MDDRTMYIFIELIALINLLRGKIVPPPPKKKHNETPTPLVKAFWILRIYPKYSDTVTVQTQSHPLFSEKTPI